MTAEDALTLLSENLPDLRQRFGVRDLALFGSVARNAARPESDVDVLVTFVDKPTFDNYMGLWVHLEELFGTSVDLAIRGDLRKELRPYIEKEALHVS